MCIKAKIALENIATDDELKNECIARLKLLKLDKTIIQDFADENKVHISNLNNCNDISNTDYKQILQLAKSFEKKHNAKVYHILYAETDNRALTYLLYTKRWKDDWKDEKVDLEKGFAEVYAYEEIKQTKIIGITVNSGKIVKVV